MFPLDYVLAVALLTAPADATDLTGSAGGCATLASSSIPRPFGR
jgi:hypothetical protein